MVLWFCTQLSSFLAFVLFRRKVLHRERIPKTGAFIVASNHGSYLDPPLVGSCFSGDMHYFARKTLWKKGFMAWLLDHLNCIPVDQDRPDMASMKRVIKILQEGGRVLLFPEGSRTEDGDLLPGQPGLGLMMAKAQVPVLPVRIFGAYESLPRWSDRLQLRKVTVVIGEPLLFDRGELSEAKGKAAYQQLSDQVMKAIGALTLAGHSKRLPQPRTVDSRA
ncbi:MAG: lysophospholipid acyltransferase family protein [Verrucomicrobiota bacterium]